MGSKIVGTSTEEQCIRIKVIDAWESLGYRGIGREEHSGENTPRELRDLYDELADNQAKQLVRKTP